MLEKVWYESERIPCFRLKMPVKQKADEKNNASSLGTCHLLTVSTSFVVGPAL